MAVYNAYPDTPYVKVHSENMVGLLTCVFVKADERDILRDVDVCTVKRGIGGIYGNKVGPIKGTADDRAQLLRDSSLTIHLFASSMCIWPLVNLPRLRVRPIWPRSWKTKPSFRLPMPCRISAEAMEPLSRTTNWSSSTVILTYVCAVVRADGSIE